MMRNFLKMLAGIHALFHPPHRSPRQGTKLLQSSPNGKRFIGAHRRSERGLLRAGFEAWLCRATNRYFQERPTK